MLIADSATASLHFKLRPDSAYEARLKGIIQADTAQLRHLALPKPILAVEKLNGPFLKFNGGILSYDWNYRGHIDTPFQEHSISQNLVSARMDFTIASSYPVTVTYYDRESNSRYFRNYHDVRVEFNSAEFNRLRNDRLKDYINQAGNQLREPSLKPALTIADEALGQANEWLNRRDVMTKLLNSKALLLNGGPPLTEKADRDSSIKAAESFVRNYERLKAYEAKLKGFRDSLQQEYVNNEKKVASIHKIMNSKLSPEARQETLQRLFQTYGMDDKQLNRIYGRWSGIRSFAVGKTTPNYSDLTVKNVNVNGVNFEYNKGIYLALSAGAVDYRARDFFYNRRKGKPQMVYAARIGYGSREGAHAYLTAFKGKKQLLSSSENPQVLDVYGLGFETQLPLSKNIRFLGEIAQSASPSLINSGGPQQKPGFRLDDHKSKAYSLSLYSWFPQTRTRIDGYYRYRGINFQSFSSFYLNATTTSWQLRGDQYFWKRTIHLSASLSENNYDNSYLPVRYAGNTVTSNVSLAFRKNKWPTLTVGLMPSSQLSEVGGQVYNNYYQSLSLSASHVYRLGLVRLVSVASYNRFYNDSKDSGFIYYNARNFYMTQSFQFLSYTANLNISRSVSQDYKLTILDAGASAKVFKSSSVGFGVKINELNDRALKVGLYGNGQILVPKVGELSAWIEKAYLPGWRDDLKKNELYHISFTRFFN